MYNNTKNKSAEILRLYKEGKMLTEICELTVASQPTVKKVLRFFDIDYDSERASEYKTRLSKIPVLYGEGGSKSAISIQLGLTSKTVASEIKRLDIVSKTKSEQSRIRYGNSLNDACFDELTPESCYWIGMLYADGHVSYKENSVDLTQHADDVKHLEKFSKFLNNSRKISKGGSGNCLRVRVNSERMHRRLLFLGFKHNKSYTAVPHILLKSSRDFWRGVVDGDGGVYDYEATSQLFLCGTLETVFDFIIFCGEFAKVKDKYPSRCKGRNLYQVSYYGQDAVKVGNLLYQNSTDYLIRKYDKYLNIINKYKNQQK